jgi:hypothetical protein
MKNFYVYLTTNLITGKQYVGDHFINVKDKKYYYGSGILISKSLKKYGEQNFFKEILDWFETKEEAFNSQEKYIQKYNTLQPNGYNISPKGGHQITGSFSEDTLKILSDKSKGHIPWNKGKSMSKSSKDQMSKSHQGLSHSQKTKDKIGKGGLGRIAWNKGKSMSKSSRDQMSKSHIDLKPSDKTREKMSKSRKEMLALKKIKEG